MDYPIQYELYTTDEIIELVAFLNALEQYHQHTHSVEGEQLLKKYHRFQSIIQNRVEEKNIAQAFEKQTNISIYKTIKNIKKA